MSKKILIILIIVIVAILVAVAGVYYIYKAKKTKEEAKDKFPKVEVGVDFNIGVDVSGVGQGTENVLKNMPPTNPLEDVANPFRDAYKNPFK